MFFKYPRFKKNYLKKIIIECEQGVSIVEEYEKQYLLGPRGLKKTSQLPSSCFNRFLERYHGCKVPSYLEYSENEVVHFVGARAINFSYFLSLRHSHVSIEG
jgi:hypothetical protein